MSDEPTNTNTPPLITDGTNQTGVPTLTSEQTLAMRSAWVAYGYSSATFDAAVGTGAQPTNTPAPSGGEPSSDLVGAVMPRPSQAPSLSPEQAQEMAQKLIEQGVDPEIVQQALAKDGLGLVPDERSDEEREHDAEFGFDHHVEPSEYNIDYMPYGARNIAPEALAAFHQGATEWLASMQAEPSMGQFIVERAMEVGQELKGLSEDQRKTWAMQQRYDMEQRFGPDAFKEQIRLAQYALKVGGPSQFVDELHLSGALSDQFVVRTLATVGARIERWIKG